MNKKGKGKLVSVTASTMPGGGKLNINDGNLSDLSHFPLHHRQTIQVIYASNNNFDSLRCFLQFQSTLIALNLSHNQFSYFDQLALLKELSGLQKLSLKGNNISSVPYYREFVISLCPQLQYLDDIKIDATERQEAFDGYQRMIVFINQLKLNELHVSILLHMILLRKCHLAMFKEIFPRYRNLMAQHISMRDSYDNNSDRNGHTNDIGFGLKKLTSGGVLRFLQYVSNHFYDRSVQTMLRKCHHKCYRSMTAEEKSYFTASREARYQYWDDLISESLKNQNMDILSLVDASKKYWNTAAASNVKQSLLASVRSISFIELYEEPSSSCGMGRKCDHPSYHPTAVSRTDRKQHKSVHFDNRRPAESDSDGEPIPPPPPPPPPATHPSMMNRNQSSIASERHQQSQSSREFRSSSAISSDEDSPRSESKTIIPSFLQFRKSSTDSQLSHNDNQSALISKDASVNRQTSHRISRSSYLSKYSNVSSPPPSNASHHIDPSQSSHPNKSVTETVYESEGSDSESELINSAPQLPSSGPKTPRTVDIASPKSYTATAASIVSTPSSAVSRSPLSISSSVKSRTSNASLKSPPSQTSSQSSLSPLSSSSKSIATPVSKLSHSRSSDSSYETPSTAAVSLSSNNSKSPFPLLSGQSNVSTIPPYTAIDSSAAAYHHHDVYICESSHSSSQQLWERTPVSMMSQSRVILSDCSSTDLSHVTLNDSGLATTPSTQLSSVNSSSSNVTLHRSGQLKRSPSMLSPLLSQSQYSAAVSLSAASSLQRVVSMSDITPLADKSSSSPSSLSSDSRSGGKMSTVSPVTVAAVGPPNSTPLTHISFNSQFIPSPALSPSSSPQLFNQPATVSGNTGGAAMDTAMSALLSTMTAVTAVPQHSYRDPSSQPVPAPSIEAIFDTLEASKAELSKVANAIHSTWEESMALFVPYSSQSKLPIDEISQAMSSLQWEYSNMSELKQLVSRIIDLYTLCQRNELHIQRECQSFQSAVTSLRDRLGQLIDISANVLEVPVQSVAHCVDLIKSYEIESTLSRFEREIQSNPKFLQWRKYKAIAAFQQRSELRCNQRSLRAALARLRQFKRFQLTAVEPLRNWKSNIFRRFLDGYRQLRRQSRGYQRAVAWERQKLQSSQRQYFHHWLRRAQQQRRCDKAVTAYQGIVQWKALEKWISYCQRKIAHRHRHRPLPHPHHHSKQQHHRQQPQRVLAVTSHTKVMNSFQRWKKMAINRMILKTLLFQSRLLRLYKSIHLWRGRAVAHQRLRTLSQRCSYRYQLSLLYRTLYQWKSQYQLQMRYYQQRRQSYALRRWKRQSSQQRQLQSLEWSHGSQREQRLLSQSFHRLLAYQVQRKITKLFDLKRRVFRQKKQRDRQRQLFRLWYEQMHYKYHLIFASLEYYFQRMKVFGMKQLRHATFRARRRQLTTAAVVNESTAGRYYDRRRLRVALQRLYESYRVNKRVRYEERHLQEQQERDRKRQFLLQLAKNRNRVLLEKIAVIHSSEGRLQEVINESAVVKSEKYDSEERLKALQDENLSKSTELTVINTELFDTNCINADINRSIASLLSSRELLVEEETNLQQLCETIIYLTRNTVTESLTSELSMSADDSSVAMASLPRDVQLLISIRQQLVDQRDQLAAHKMGLVDNHQQHMEQLTEQHNQVDTLLQEKLAKAKDDLHAIVKQSETVVEIDVVPQLHSYQELVSLHETAFEGFESNMTHELDRKNKEIEELQAKEESLRRKYDDIWDETQRYQELLWQLTQ